MQISITRPGRLGDGQDAGGKRPRSARPDWQPHGGRTATARQPRGSRAAAAKQKWHRQRYR
jgi:hypothetical protein